MLESEWKEESINGWERKLKKETSLRCWSLSRQVARCRALEPKRKASDPEEINSASMQKGNLE